jgi:hypothetical protein
MKHIKTYWYIYLPLALAAIYAGISLFRNEWNPMNWFSASGAGERKRGYSQCINGTLYISACPNGCPSASAGPCSPN